jgi:hypothetical protein
MQHTTRLLTFYDAMPRPALVAPFSSPYVHLFLSPHSISNPTLSGPHPTYPLLFFTSPLRVPVSVISYFMVVDLRIKAM